MKRFSVFLILSSSLIVSNTLHAKETVEDTEILAQRGKGVVTQTAFTARADKIPADQRRATLRHTGRFRDLLNTLLLRAQLAVDAREAGYDTDPRVINRMKLAADAELGDAWMQHYIEMQPEGDYEQLAREYYQLNQESMLSSPSIDVSHILVTTKERSEEEAQELADSISRQLEQEPALFDQLVMEHSEDPSASANKGKFSKVKKGDMVARFEAAAFALQQGEISAPVKTEFGFHIIRLDAHHEPEKSSFDGVKQQLVERERKLHQERIRRDYLSSLTSIDVVMTEDALEEMVRRQFGEEYSDLPEDEAETE